MTVKKSKSRKTHKKEGTICVEDIEAAGIDPEEEANVVAGATEVVVEEALILGSWMTKASFQPINHKGEVAIEEEVRDVVAQEETLLLDKIRLSLNNDE